MAIIELDGNFRRARVCWALYRCKRGREAGASALQQRFRIGATFVSSQGYTAATAYERNPTALVLYLILLIHSNLLHEVFPKGQRIENSKKKYLSTERSRIYLNS